MPNPLLISINTAVRESNELRLYFNRYLGTAEHPRGQILSAYRNGRNALGAVLNRQDANMPQQVQQTLDELRRSVQAAILAGMSESIVLGRESAQRQMAAYEAAGVTAQVARQTPRPSLYSAAPVALLDQQIQAANTLILTGAAPEEIIGDGTRLGLLQPSPVQNEAARWLRTAVTGGFIGWLLGTQPPAPAVERFPFMRQAIAGIDERTTNCCLQVHGQIVGMNEDFTLTGTPRYADRQKDPPFHNYCRSSVTLYLPEFDDGYTDMMQEAAQLEQQARESDNYKAPHPANAFTRVMR